MARAKRDDLERHIERHVRVMPGLRSPVLVAGFQGWNDGGQGASAAVRWLARNLDGERIASIRPDAFHVFSEMQSRPIVRIRNGERVLRWPSHDMYAIRGGPGWSNDLVAFVAREPELRWRTYCQAALSVAEEVGVKRVVTLGAFLGAVPHTRPVSISGYAWSEDEQPRLGAMGTLTTSYEGPTGIVSVLSDAARARGMSAASLWAAVPHYLPTTANPKAALALLRAVRDLTDLPFDLSRLEDASAFFERQVSEAVRAKSEVAEHVHELEEQAGAAGGEVEAVKRSAPGDLPNPADVIQAFEDLLRQGRRPGASEEQ